MSMLELLPVAGVGDATAATKAINSFVSPLITVLATVGGIVCTLAIMYSGYLWIFASGDSEKLRRAKSVLKHALVGFVIVLIAAAVTTMLHHAYTTPAPGSGTTIPAISQVQPQSTPTNWSTILIDALDGFFEDIITTLASPILNVLSKFTTSTPLMANQQGVFEVWLVMGGIAVGLFTLVVAIQGFRVMLADMFDFGEVEVKTLLPQIGLVYLVMSSSIFLIDLIISVSNAIISAIYSAFPSTDIWKSLIDTAVHVNGLPLASLLIFIAFTVLACMLVIFYLERIIILCLGAAISPLVVLLWLVPGFREFANNLIRTYVVVVFVLVVHVVILMLGATLLNNELLGPTATPNPLADLLIGVAILTTLLSTQKFLVGMSIVSSGQATARNMGRQFMTGMRYTGDKFDEYAGAQLAELVPELRKQYALLALGGLE